jgi:predicted DNA-binding transcriptional regulator YafY
MQSFVNRLIRMDHLILYKSTGRPADLASKLDISERSVYEYIRFMKGLGAPICFSRNRGTYYYKDSGNFAIGFFASVVPTNKHVAGYENQNEIS